MAHAIHGIVNIEKWMPIQGLQHHECKKLHGTSGGKHQVSLCMQIHWNVSDEHGWQTDGPTILETWAAMEKLVDLVSKHGLLPWKPVRLLLFCISSSLVFCGIHSGSRVGAQSKCVRCL